MMNKGLLLDTHIWIWLACGDTSLSPAAVHQIDKYSKTSALYISAISVWEVAMLEAKGKIKIGQAVLQWVKAALACPEIILLPLSPEIAVESCQLSGNFHGDPADRILVASARIEKLALMTKDKKIITYSKDNFLTVLDL